MNLDAAFLNSIQPCLIKATKIGAQNCRAPGVSYGKRTVKYYELDYIIWGEGCIVTNGEPVPTVKGDMFFRTPGMEVEGIAPYHCLFIIFSITGNSPDPAIDNDVYNAAAPCQKVNFNFPVKLNMKNTSYVQDLMTQIYNDYIEQKDFAPFTTRLNIMQLLYHIYNQWNSENRFEKMSKSLNHNAKSITAVKEFIENNPYRNHTLKDLAEMSNLSRYFFCRVFKDIVGQTPINYVNMCKINACKKLLLETEKSVKEIMYQCGFDNESHFFRLFKRYTGVTPSVFRSPDGV